MRKAEVVVGCFVVAVAFGYVIAAEVARRMDNSLGRFFRGEFA